MQTNFTKKNLAFLLMIFGLFLSFSPQQVQGQTGDCPYPIIFLHGWTGNENSFIDTYSDPDFENLWGARADVFYAMQNASFSTNVWGYDGLADTPDDDVLTWFTNETNELAPGCIYAINLDNSWNQDVDNPIIYKNDGDAIAFNESDSNEAAIYKAGQMFKKCIAAVLAANPDKEKVILAGHSMGGLHIREYLQRRSPATPTGTPVWWIDPTSPDGHKVARVLTSVTPHGGSNTMGNISNADDETAASRDGLPDLNSSAVRDLRYNWSCGALGLFTCTAAYLWGGDEDAGWGWWSEDVNCDGDENDDNVVGINIDGETQGVGDEWDGTYDNPNIPLPENIHYTWMTADIFGDDGDGVVHWSRQWLYENNIARPNDGVNWRLSDSIFVNRFHLSANDYAEEVIRGLDEPDYPLFAYNIELNHTYSDVLTYRPTVVPEGLPTADVDFFKFDIPADYSPNQGLEIRFTTHAQRAIKVTYYDSAPADYLDFNDNGALGGIYAANTGDQIITISPQLITPGATAYLKIQADDISISDWKTPILFSIETPPPLAIEWSGFWGEAMEAQIALQWKTEQEVKSDRFEVQRSNNGIHFETIGTVAAKGTSSTPQQYDFLDEQPLHGDNYYRLKSIDTDASFEYSESLHFTIQQQETTIGKVYPVPAEEEVIIDLETTTAQDWTWLMTDAMGRPVKSGTQALNAGEQQLRFSLEDLTTGVYFINLKTERFSEQVRVLKK